MPGFEAEEDSTKLGLADAAEPGKAAPLKLGLDEAWKGAGADNLKLGFGKGCKLWPGPIVRLAAGCCPSPIRVWLGLGKPAAA